MTKGQRSSLGPSEFEAQEQQAAAGAAIEDNLPPEMYGASS